MQILLDKYGPPRSSAARRVSAIMYPYPRPISGEKLFCRPVFLLRGLQNFEMLCGFRQTGDGCKNIRTRANNVFSRIFINSE